MRGFSEDRCTYATRGLTRACHLARRLRGPPGHSSFISFSAHRLCAAASKQVMTFNKKRLAGTLPAICAAWALVFAAGFAPAASPVTPQQWHEDLKYLAREL